MTLPITAGARRTGDRRLRCALAALLACAVMVALAPLARASAEPAVPEYGAQVAAWTLFASVLLSTGLLGWLLVRSRRHSRVLDGRLAQLSVVTEAQRVTEEALRASEKRYRDLVETSHDLLWSVDAEGRWTFLNRQATLRIYGCEPTEMLGRRFTEFTPPEYRERDLEVFERIKAGEPYFHYETVHLAKDGRRVAMLFNAIVLRDAHGNVLGTTGTAADITESKRAEAELQRERRLFMGGPVVVFRWLAEPGWPVDYVSPNVLQLFGHTAKDFMTGRVPYADVVHPDDLERLGAEVSSHSAAGDACFEQEYRIVRGGGDVRWLYDFTVVSRDATGRVTHYDGYVLDATERKREENEREEMQARLRETQKLESLGVLAGGIAHDFNNLLTGILGNAELALAGLGPDCAERGYLEQLVRASGRAADLTRQLLAYAGGGSFERRAIDVSDHIREITPLLSSVISKKVQLRLELEGRLPPVQADPAQFQQLVMNLVINGAEACGEGSGTVVIRTGLVDVSPEDLRTAVTDGEVEPGPHVYFEVQDDGCGMDELTRARIFEPFFTTKFSGRGLGLAAVLGIVRTHRGALHVRSAPGRGSTFRVSLPRSSADLSVANPPDASDPRGTGLILVVDDEPAVRNVAQASLTAFGYDVLLAENGREGLELFRARAADIDLVLLDMTMPLMSGAETFCAMRALRPDMLAILSSGYDEAEATQEFLGEGLAGFIQKPYTPRALAAKVQAVLASRLGSVRA